MPRIWAAVAVVAMVGVSIGVNIARFPVVWEMMGAPRTSVPPSRSAPPPKSPRLERLDDLSKVAPPVIPQFAPSKNSPIHLPGVDPIVPAPSGLAGADPAKDPVAEAYRGVEPIEAAPSRPSGDLSSPTAEKNPSSSTAEPSRTTAAKKPFDAAEGANVVTLGKPVLGRPSDSGLAELETRWPSETSPAMEQALKARSNALAESKTRAETRTRTAQTTWEADQPTTPFIWAKNSWSKDARPNRDEADGKSLDGSGGSDSSQIVTPKLVPVSVEHRVRRLPPVIETPGRPRPDLARDLLPNYPRTGR